MSEFFNQNSKSKSSGMSTLDLMGETAPVRRVVRFMLRKSTQTYAELCEAIDALPEGKRPTREELDGALERLCEMEWLFREEVDGQVIYSIKVQPKVGSDVSRAGTGGEKASRTMKKLWDAVDSTAEEDPSFAPKMPDAVPAKTVKSDTQSEQEEAPEPPEETPLRGVFQKLWDAVKPRRKPD